MFRNFVPWQARSATRRGPMEPVRRGLVQGSGPEKAATRQEVLLFQFLICGQLDGGQTNRLKGSENLTQSRKRVKLQQMLARAAPDRLKHAPAPTYLYGRETPHACLRRAAGLMSLLGLLPIIQLVCGFNSWRAITCRYVGGSFSGTISTAAK